MKKPVQFFVMAWLAISLFASVLIAEQFKRSLIADVTVFHTLPVQQGRGTMFSSVPVNRAMEGSLEFASYEKLISEELIKCGWRKSMKGQTPEVVVLVDYGIDDGKDVVRTVPGIGLIGPGSSRQDGTIGRGLDYHGRSYSDPSIVIVPQAKTVCEYTRTLVVHMVDGTDFQSGKITKKYEGKVVSKGSCSQLAEVMPTMIKALLSDFPGDSGKAKQLQLNIQNQTEYEERVVKFPDGTVHRVGVDKSQSSFRSW